MEDALCTPYTTLSTESIESPGDGTSTLCGEALTNVISLLLLKNNRLFGALPSCYGNKVIRNAHGLN